MMLLSRLEKAEKNSPSGGDYSMMGKSYHNFNGCNKAFFRKNIKK